MPVPAIPLLPRNRLLADAYEVNGVENGRYHHAVRNILGQRYGVIVSVFQLANLFLISITFSITGSTAMAAMGALVCGGGACFDSMWKMSCIFGAVEVFLSQVPSLESAWWVSTLGVVTSSIYSTIALALGIKYGGLRAGMHGVHAGEGQRLRGVEGGAARETRLGGSCQRRPGQRSGRGRAASRRPAAET